MPDILYIEDDESVRDSMLRLFESAGLKKEAVEAVATVDEAIRVYDKNPDIKDIVSDWNLARGENAEDAIRYILKRSENIPVFIITGRKEAAENFRERARKEFPDARITVLPKLFMAEDLLKSLQAAVSGERPAPLARKPGGHDL